MTLYEKRGRRYYPVAEYAPEVADSMPAGHHLVSVIPGRKVTRYRIDPDAARVLAAIADHRDALCRLVSDASKGRIVSDRLIEYPAAYDIVDALAQAIVEAGENER